MGEKEDFEPIKGIKKVTEGWLKGDFWESSENDKFGAKNGEIRSRFIPPSRIGGKNENTCPRDVGGMERERGM